MRNGNTVRSRVKVRQINAQKRQVQGQRSIQAFCLWRYWEQSCLFARVTWIDYTEYTECSSPTSRAETWKTGASPRYHLLLLEGALVCLQPAEYKAPLLKCRHSFPQRPGQTRCLHLSRVQYNLCTHEITVYITCTERHQSHLHVNAIRPDWQADVEWNSMVNDLKFLIPNTERDVSKSIKLLKPRKLASVLPDKCGKKQTQSHYRPGQALTVPGDWGSQISRQSALESDKAVRPKNRPPLPHRKYSWYSFLLEAELDPRAIARPEGLCSWKIPMTSPRIELPPFRLVAQWRVMQILFGTVAKLDSLWGANSLLSNEDKRKGVISPGIGRPVAAGDRPLTSI
jgi:hypothetical protein